MSKLTKQHFIAIAEAIAKLESVIDRRMMFEALLPMLVASNPAFDRNRFAKAAKL